MELWKDQNIKKLYVIGVASVAGVSMDGQKEGWMLEGLFDTEQEAVDHCACDDHFVAPVPVGVMVGEALPDGMWWPRLQSKEEGQARLEAFRRGEL